MAFYFFFHKTSMQTPNAKKMPSATYHQAKGEQTSGLSCGAVIGETFVLSVVESWDGDGSSLDAGMLLVTEGGGDGSGVTPNPSAHIPFRSSCASRWASRIPLMLLSPVLLFPL